MPRPTLLPRPIRFDQRIYTGAVIHWPVAFPYGGDFEPLDPNKPDWVVLDTDTSLVDTWQAMIKLRDTGKVKAIGVSNFTPAHIQGIVDATGVWPVRRPLPALKFGLGWQECRRVDSVPFVGSEPSRGAPAPPPGRPREVLRGAQHSPDGVLAARQQQSVSFRNLLRFWSLF